MVVLYDETLGDNPLSSLGRDILEEIVMHVEDGRERLRFSGCVSKEIKRMLWQGSREMPLELYRGATLVVKEKDIETLSWRRENASGQILMSERIVVEGPRELSSQTSIARRRNVGDDAGIDLEFCGLDLDDCESRISTLFSRVLGYSDTNHDTGTCVPVCRMTMHNVTFGSGYKAMVDVLRHAAFRQLKTLHLKNISVILSHQDSLCHLEQLEDLLIQNAFVSIVPRPDGEQHVSSCLPQNLKRIEMISSTCTLSMYEWIQFCGTTLAHSCEELVLEDVGCCHTTFCHSEHVYTGSLDLSHCERLKRIKIGSSHCFQNRGSMPCMPYGITVVLSNDVVESVDIDCHATHGVTWVMQHQGSSNLRELKIRGSDWKRRFHVEHFSQLALPHVHVLDLEMCDDDQPPCLLLKDIIDHFRGGLKRVIVRIGLCTVDTAFLNTVVQIVQECPRMTLTFSPR